MEPRRGGGDAEGEGRNAAGAPEVTCRQKGTYCDWIMNQQYLRTLRVFEQLRPGDTIRLRHQVKVGFRSWETTIEGKVVQTQRRRHGLHYQRNFDDKAFSDVLVVQRPDGELTTLTLDEFTMLEKLPQPPAEEISS